MPTDTPLDLDGLKQQAENIRFFAQDLLDNGHLFGGAIGNMMAIRDEADKLLATMPALIALARSQEEVFRAGWTAHETGYQAAPDGCEAALRAYRVNPDIFGPDTEEPTNA